MIHLIFRKIIKKYTLSFLIIFLCGILLKSPDTHWLHVGVGLFLIHGWVYFVHRGLHILPKWGLLDYINTHMNFHHQEDKPLSRPIELFFEVLTDLGMNLLVIPVQYILGVNIIPIPCVLLFTLSYTSIHLFNYSIIGSLFHKRHHLTINKNFAPDAMDHILGTNYNEEYEDLVPMCLNVLISCGILYCFYPAP